MTDFHLSNYEHRRRELMQLMGGGIAVFPTAPEVTRNSDVLYPFRPDSDFYYLTHFPEPAAVAVLVPGRPQGEFILFCRERDPEKETWNGRRRGLEGAIQDYGADDAFPIDDIAEILPGLLEDQDRIYCNMGRYLDFRADQAGFLKYRRWGMHRQRRNPGRHPPIRSDGRSRFLFRDHALCRTRQIRPAAGLELVPQRPRVLGNESENRNHCQVETDKGHPCFALLRVPWEIPLRHHP